MTSAHTSPVHSPSPIGSLTGRQIRTYLREGRELALLDVREEAPFAQAHPLFAANLPFSRIELDAHARIPRRATLLILYDDGEGLAAQAALAFARLGYSAIHLLEGGLAGWRAGGGEIFSDVNTPSKAFGELVESRRHTPSLAAPEVKALLDAGADVVVLDARRFDEFHTMSIPGATSTPGAELVLRVRELAPRPETLVIVNCAGRTRSIIGAQSLINAGIPNPVAALRNGTIGWTLAGQTLEKGSGRRGSDLGPPDAQHHAQARTASLRVANRAGVGRTDCAALARWERDTTRTTYRFDVRTREQFEAGHVPGFRSAPGGQLVQETDHAAPVRGARIVLADDDGVRANMSASWLAQMGWEVYVLDGLPPQHFNERGGVPAKLPDAPASTPVTPHVLARWLKESGTLLLDFASSADYVERHIPGARFALRSQLPAVLAKLPAPERYVLTCGSGALARYVSGDLQALTGKPVLVLDGGTEAWINAGLPLEAGEAGMASPRIDRYSRPYEGTGNPLAAMQAYLDWEFGLVEQLGRDATHGFFVI